MIMNIPRKPICLEKGSVRATQSEDAFTSLFSWTAT